MPTLSSHAPAHTTPSSKRDGADFEPDDEWKRKLKQDIEQSFKSMIQSARDNQQVQLIEGNLSQEELDHEYKRTLHNIKGLAEEQYQLALMKERNERRWIAGVQMLPGWNDVLHEEQQNIMNSIKQSNHSDNSARAAESPTDERSTNGPPPSSSAPGVPHHEGSEPQSSDPPPTREAQTRDRPWSRTLSSPSSSSTDRRRRDNNTQRSSSRDREDQAPPPSSSSLRRHNADQHRPTLSEIFPDTPLTQEPEEQHPPSSRSSSGRPRSNSEKPWDPSLGKSSASIRSVSSADRHHFGRSPPKNANSAPPTQNPDLRRSSTTSQEDPPPLPPATKYQIGRRGSTASIRSTGSGHSGKSIRHPTTETIPERADDVEESPSTSTVKERVRKSTADKPPRDKESKRGSRRDSRPTPVDASIMNRYEHEPAPLPSSLRSAPGPSSSTMQYATSSSSSFVEERFHHPPERDRPLKSSRPYLDSDPPYHSREAPQYAPRDMPPSARPGPAPPPRPSPYVEERDFVGPFPPLGRTPASPFTGERESLRDTGRDRDRDSLRERERDREREREYHPSISHKSSFSSYDERWRRERDWEQWDEDREARERDNRDREYWERDQRERERGGRDWDHPRERDRGERERDRDRELYERQHREREYAHPHSTPYSARTGGYPTPPSSASRLAQPHVGSVADYLPMQEIYDDGTVPPSSAAAAARGSYGSYRGVVPSPTAMQDDWDYPPRPESGRPSIPTRQPSYGRREGERRGTIDTGGPPELVTDGYIRSYTHTSVPSPAGSIPIPRAPPSNGGIIDDAPPPAWQTWHAESARHRPPSSANDTWASSARSPTNPSVLAASSSGASGGVLPPLQPVTPSLRPNSVAPVAEDHQRRTERRASVKTYHSQQQGHPNRPIDYVDDRAYHPPAAAAVASTGGRHRVLLNEDQDEEDFSADSGRSNPTSEEESELERYSGDREEDDDDEEEEDDEDDEEDDEVDVKARELEAESQRIERDRREADAKIREQALELQRLKDEERRMEEEARKIDEEEKRKEEDLRRKEEDLRRKEEEAELLEARRAAERLADDARKKEEETKKKEKEVKRREEEARRKADDARRLKLDAAKKAEEAKRKEAEVKLKEEETKKKEEQLKEDEARNQALKRQAEQIAREAKKAKETIKKLEEETRKKELQIQEREAALLLREEELQRRETEARAKEEDSKREEHRRNEEEAREAAKRKKEEARRREEELRQREEEARRKEEEATKRRDDEAREAAKRKEDEARERNRREQQRQQQESERWFHEDEFIAGFDPKVIEEQTRLFQQAQFRKREEEIKRSRAEERKRQDSMGAESAWTPSFASASPTAASNTNAHPSSSPNTYTSASPGTSPGMSRPPPQYSGSFNSDRNGAPTRGTSNSGWSSATKPTTVPSSSSTRTSSSIPSSFGKPRTGSVSSGTNPPGASPLGSEEWARRQQDFVNDQHEKFRREQEKIEADNLLRSAGKPLSRDEMVRLFELHEKMWNRIAVPGTEQFTWSDIPWPMAKMPAGPDDISQPLIGAYMQSPWWPEKDKAKSTKDRIKDSLKRWHPDRFDNRCLMRVVDSDQDRVKEGSGNVVRYLNELLRKENESANGIFAGD